jgi:ketosteroid isomerase-like protein
MRAHQPADPREVWARAFNVGARFEREFQRALEAGDLALVFSRWTLRGRGPNGTPLEPAGQTSGVVRRQAEGTWVSAIDTPFGGAGV